MSGVSIQIRFDLAEDWVNFLELSFSKVIRSRLIVKPVVPRFR
jgi:hypothetical protein